MSTNLQNIQFSFRGDIVEDLTGGLLNQGITNTLGGNDVLQGKSPVDLTQLAQSPIAVLSYGIRNTATGQLWTIWGDDFLSGEGMIGIENAGFIFTGSGNDTITAEGIVALNNLGLINTESGNDTILTRDKGAGSYGSELTLGTIKSEGLGVGILRNSGSILMGAGHDTLSAIGPQSFVNSGVLNLSSGVIDMSYGNDSIIGESFYGIRNSEGGRILTGTGHDWLKGTGFVGINNSGLIDTGYENDLVNGEGFVGISNTGTILTGGGQDRIVASGAFGVYNLGILDMGFENDVLIGLGRNESGIGIWNTGQMNLGGGEDVAKGFSDILGNSISGGGTLDLGSGNDRLSAFGNQTVNGGFGFDIVLLDGSFDAEFQRNLTGFALGGPFGIGLGSLPNSFVLGLGNPITGETIEMTVVNFEEFRFVNRTFSAQELRTILGA